MPSKEAMNAISVTELKMAASTKWMDARPGDADEAEDDVNAGPPSEVSHLVAKFRTTTCTEWLNLSASELN